MEITGVAWHTSSYSGSGGGNCVEIGAHADGGGVLVRDTKDRHGPVLAFGPEAWQRFADQVKAEARNSNQ